MKRIQSGFSLIELMIVVAIIGVLAAIAVSGYQDYVRRIYVSEGLTLASGAKTSVTEYHVNNNAFPGDNATAGLAAAASISGGAVSRVEVANGIITVVFNAKVDNYDLKLTPTGGGGSITWSCNGGSIPVKYLPLNCR